MKYMRIFKSVYSAIFLVFLFTGLSGCGSNQSSPISNTDSPNGLLLDWPPEGSPTRTLSDDEITIAGSQFSASDGEIGLALPDTIISLSPGGSLTYTMYSMTGFGNGIEVDSIFVDYLIEDPVGKEGSTKLFFGISNYTAGAWNWFEGDPENSEILFPNGADYASVNGDLHIAAVLHGEGTAVLTSITVRRVGDTTLYPPENLVADPDVNQVLLTWDESHGAWGYNVYRNRARNDEEYELLNTEPITDTTYLDDTVARNFIYYYRVTSVGNVESEMGNRVDIYTPQEDLYLPINNLVSDNGTDFFRVNWEWEGEDPDSWILFLKEEDDFDLFDPVSVHGISIPFLRTHKFTGLIPGRSYFWRICAVVNGKRGKMTDDLPGVTEGLWTWEPIEEIAPGASPLSVVTVDNDLSVAYINGVNGEFGRRTDGTWSTETVLLPQAVGGAMVSIDLAYGGSKYAMVGQEGSPGDVISTIGTPGDWTHYRIDGNGATGPGHENSGANAQIAANENFFLTSYINDDTFQMAYQITPTDEINWTSKSILWEIYNGISQFSIAPTANNFHMLFYRYQEGNEGLKFYSYDDGDWNMSDIFPDGPSEIGHYNDLTMSASGEWCSPAYYPSEFQMHFVHEAAPDWTSVQTPGNDRQGDNATMAAVGDRMFSVFKNRDFSIWMLAIYDAGEWEVSALSIPGVDIRTAKLAAIGDTPYIVFHDQDGDDMIKCAPGTPPV